MTKEPCHPERSEAKPRDLWKSLAIVAAMAFPLAVSAQMSSTNYRVPFDALGGGGDRSSSTNYVVEDTLAEQASPTGEDLSSANFLACVGYQCLFGQVPFLSTGYSVSPTPCTGSTTSTPPFNVDLGTLTSTAVNTAVNHICVRVSTNSFGSVLVTGSDVSGALVSVSNPSDVIQSATATLQPGTTGYGFCSFNAANGFTAEAPYNGACDATHHEVGGMSASDHLIWSSTGTPLTDAIGDLLTKAAVSAVVPAHTDYEDTLTVIVTATF